ncbi:MAG: peptidoglycan-binding protein [Hyphomicrobiaceae bacterium]
MASNQFDKPPRDAIFPLPEELSRAPSESAPDPQEFDGPFDLIEDEAETRAAVPSVSWPKADADAPDYAHLEPDGREPVVGDKRFWIDAADIERLIAANGFDPRGPEGGPDGKNGRIVIAFRGALLVDDQDEDNDGIVTGVDKLYLEETRPNHTDFRCVIGYLDRATGKISAYTASTVPHVKYMTNYYKWYHGIGGDGRTKCNMLPTGCYVFRVGVHAGSIRPALRLTDPDVLSNDGSATVLRTTNDLTFKVGDDYDRCMPYDNVHCAYSDDTFSSAGCLTIKGRDGQGPWGQFQAYLKTLRYDTRIDVLLLTGREASIAAWLRDTGRAVDDEMSMRLLRRLRIGSVGDAVNRLQEKLGFNPSGYFGPFTKDKLAAYQKSNDQVSDGIWSPRLEGAVHWPVLNPPVAEPAAAADVVPPAAVEPPPPVEPPAEQLVSQHEAPQPQAPIVVADATRSPVEAASAAGTEPAAAGEPTQPADQADGVAAPAIVAAPVRIMLTDERIREFAPRALPQYREALLAGNEALAKYGLDASPLRLCHFLGQIGNECGRLTILEENLNYRTADRLRVVWPTRFPTIASALPYVGNPQKLAEKVYGGRFDNRPGDGWRYRGRGFVQITGRSSYREMGERLKIPLEDQPDLATDPQYALLIACETWANKQLKGERDMNRLADANKLEALTYRINGGYTNLEDRRDAFEEAWTIWAEGNPPRRVLEAEILDRGDRSQRVEELNARLRGLGLFDGVTSTPPLQVFNYSTYRAVCVLQQNNGAEATGVVGAETWGLMEKALQRGPVASAVKRGQVARQQGREAKRDPILRRLRDVRGWSIALCIAALLFVVGYIVSLNVGRELIALWLPVLFAGVTFVCGLALRLAAADPARTLAAEAAARRRGPVDGSAPAAKIGAFADGEEEPVRMGINI